MKNSLSATLMDENLVIAEKIITTWDLEKSGNYTNIAYLFKDYRFEAKEFIRSVNGLQTAMHFYLSENPSSEKLIKAQNLMQIAVKRLEREFYNILSKNKSYRDFNESISVSSGSSNSSNESISEDIEICIEISDDDDEIKISDSNEELKISYLEDLKLIADTMISIGYGKECIKIYKLVRKSIVDESLYSLGVIENLSLSNMQKMDWETIEVKIRNWLKSVKIAVNTVFNGEKTLCGYIFGSSSSTSESCFSEITTGGAQNLFVFPENVAKLKKLSPEKMFRILDIYNVLSELMPEIELIFSYNATLLVKKQAFTSILKLRERVGIMLTGFESAIQKESTKLTLPGGGIHPVTRYVMNYLVFLSDYDMALTDIIEDWPLIVQSPLPESYFPSSESVNEVSALSVRLAWIVLVLLCKLDAKAELYREVSQSYLFLANNLNYIVSKVKSSKLRFLIGDDWLAQSESKVKQYAGSYERMGWNKVFSCLPDENDDVSPISARVCFRNFNVAFIDACKKQENWMVPGPDLRAEIKSSLGEKIVPIYREFYEKHREMFYQEELIVRFAPEDVEKCVWELFNGSNNGDNSSSTIS